MIEEQNIAVAVCDACRRKDYGDEQGLFDDGYTITIDEHATDTQHEGYACKETHIGKAARNVLNRWRASEILPPPRDEDGTDTPPPDAPPLPEYNGDATAAVVS